MECPFKSKQKFITKRAKQAQDQYLFMEPCTFVEATVSNATQTSKAIQKNQRAVSTHTKRTKDSIS